MSGTGASRFDVDYRRPVLVKEQRSTFPFLGAAFAKGGVLDGKEVYAFSPSTLTVVEGDTIHFTLINPEDDVHSFVLPDFAVSLPGNSPAFNSTATIGCAESIRTIKK